MKIGTTKGQELVANHLLQQIKSGERRQAIGCHRSSSSPSCTASVDVLFAKLLAS